MLGKCDAEKVSPPRSFADAEDVLEVLCVYVPDIVLCMLDPDFARGTEDYRFGSARPGSG